MKIRILAIMVIAIMTASCSDSETTTSGNRDTATTIEKENTAIAAMKQNASVANIQKEPQKIIEKSKIDLSERRVFLPGDGWISAETFRDIYYNQPQKLPGDLDFDLVHQLMILIESEQPPADTSDNPADESNDPAATGSNPAEEISDPAKEITNPTAISDNPAEEISNTRMPETPQHAP